LKKLHNVLNFEKNISMNKNLKSAQQNRKVKQVDAETFVLDVILDIYFIKLWTSIYFKHWNLLLHELHIVLQFVLSVLIHSLFDTKLILLNNWSWKYYRKFLILKNMIIFTAYYNYYKFWELNKFENLFKNFIIIEKFESQIGQFLQNLIIFTKFQHFWENSTILRKFHNVDKIKLNMRC
jgi:hypothetical protein